MPHDGKMPDTQRIAQTGCCARSADSTRAPPRAPALQPRRSRQRVPTQRAAQQGCSTCSRCPYAGRKDVASAVLCAVCCLRRWYSWSQPTRV